MRRVRPGVLIAAAVVGSLGYRIAAGNTRLAELVAGSVLVGLALAVAKLCAGVARRDHPQGLGWKVLAAGLCSLAAGVALYVAIGVFDLTGPVTTAMVVLCMGFRLLVLIAVMLSPLARATRRSGSRALLDALAVGSSMAYIGWGFVLSGLIHGSTRSAASRSALFALIDLVLVAFVLVLAARRTGARRRSSMLLGGGLLLLAVSDWTVGIGMLDGVTRPPISTAVSSMLALVLIGAAAAVAAGRTEPAPEAPTTAEKVRLPDWLPIAAGCAAAASSAVFYRRWTDDPLLIALAVVVAGSLLAWQIAVLLENAEMMRTVARETRRFQALVDMAPVAIIEVDLEGRVQLWNREAAELVGRSERDMIGAPLRGIDFATPDGQPAGPRVLGGEIVRDLEVKVVRQDFEVADVVVSAAPILADDAGVTGVVIVASDDGPRRNAQAAMIDAQRMQAFEQMAGGIAHDFNNRLAVVLGTTEILLAEAQAGSSGDEEMLEAILSAGQRAAQLVDQLVTYTRRHVEEPEPLDLNEVVRDLQPILERLASPLASLELDLAPGQLVVTADRAALEQALMNLVSNAFEAMPDTSPDGVAVTVTTRASQPGHQEHGRGTLRDDVELVVCDRGGGIDPAIRTRIFEPFFTTKASGRGLGLSAVQGIVRRSNGDLRIDSSPDEGTTVTVRLPRTQVAAPAAAPPATSLAPPDRSHLGSMVLVVDDEAPVRTLAAGLLRHAGYEVTEAASAEDAIRLIEDEWLEFDVLLTDVVMPGMSGVELARLVRRSDPTAPVLLMSGFVADALEAGVEPSLPFDLLAKPFTGAALVDAVGRALASAAEHLVS